MNGLTTKYTNIVLAVPHSVGMPLDFDWRGDAKVAASAKRWTDWHTDDLFGVEDARISVVKGRLSRFDCDDERLEDEGDRLCRYAIEGGIDQREIGARQWNARLAEWFRYRAELMAAVAQGDRPLIIDCHSFPSDLAPDVDICIGFNEDCSKPSKETLAVVTDAFRAAGYTVAHNRPYSNAIAPLGYRGHSLMIEVNKRCYLDADELDVGEGFAKLHQTLSSIYTKLLMGMSDMSIGELKELLSTLLHKAEILDFEKIPESRKKIPVWDLEGAPVRIKSMIGNALGVDTIWDLVHVPHGKFLQYRCFTNSRARMLELVAAVDEAIKLLNNKF